MKGIDLAIALDPEYVRQFAALASFEYPAVAAQELLRGWAKVPVWPQLWGYTISILKTGGGVFPPPGNMVEYLLDLADKDARKVDPDGIKHRAQKLVMDFLREMHAYSLLGHSDEFSYVHYQKIMDLQYNIDFEVLPKGKSPVGIQTAMRKNWNADTWRQIHQERRQRRGAKDWKGPIFWMTNRRIVAEELPNRLWLFKMYHVEEIILEIKGQIKEFDARFLLATRPYPPKVSRDLLRECRDDIKMFGWGYAQQKWAKFTEIPKEGTCPVCGSTDWWWRPDSQWGPGEWLCGRCHPNPNKEAEVTTEKEKGHCKHGEFNLTEGCEKCIAERSQAGIKPERDEMENGLNSEGLTLASTHAPYHLADSTIVPSVTTVLGILDKPGLPHWAWELGRQGLDYREVRDTAGRVGTIAHRLIACHLKGETADYQPLAVYPDEASKVERCFVKYLAWEKENPLSPVMIEKPLISEEFKFGGTLDLLAEIDGDFILLDFKTGNGIYESYFYQLAAYRKLLEEQGWPVAGARILRISPDDSEAEVAMGLDYDRDWEIFQHCLGIYRLQNSGVV